MFSRILLAVDLEGAAHDRLLSVATGMARLGGGRIDLMTVVPDFGMSIVGSFFPQGFERAALDKARTALDPLLERIRAEGIEAEAHIGHGPIYDEILRAANRLGCDAIVIGAHRPELRDYLLGPNAARVVRHAGQSVIVVRES